MNQRRFLATALAAALAAGLLALPVAGAAQDGDSRQRLKQNTQAQAAPSAPSRAKAGKPATKSRAKPKARKTQPKARPKAAKAKPKLAPRAPVAAALRPSTDTESRIMRPGDYRFAIQHGGLARTYSIHVPGRYDRATLAPLVVALHGSGGSADWQANDAYHGLVSKSDREGFVVVFPNGYSQSPGGKPATWNAGQCCGVARDGRMDDVGFIRQVVDNVFRQLSIDRDRIFATGMASGAMMTYRLACEMPGVFKAVAPVAGADTTAQCEPRNPVSVLHIHARDDSRVPFDGGAGPGAAGPSQAADFPSVQQTIGKWAQLNGCSATPQRVLEKAGAYCEAYGYCRGRAEVQLCVTETGGHSWPGGKPARGASPASQALSATDAMWSFFSRH